MVDLSPFQLIQSNKPQLVQRFQREMLSFVSEQRLGGNSADSVCQLNVLEDSSMEEMG